MAIKGGTNMPLVASDVPRVRFTSHGHSFHSLEKGLAVSEPLYNQIFNALTILESQTKWENGL